jgi:hypothetical protein
MAKEKKGVSDAFEKVEFLYSKGAIVNLQKNPRYAEKSLTGRPSIDWVTDGMGYTIGADVASSAKRLGILEMKGSWVTYKGTALVQGIDNLVPMLFDNPELLEDLKLEIVEKTKKEIEE